MKRCAAAAAVLLAVGWWGPNLKVLGAQQSAPGSTAVQGTSNPAEGIEARTPPKTTNPAAGPATAKTASTSEPAFYILAELTQSLNAKKLKPGERVNAEVMQDVLAHGKVIIPVESKLVGHVTEVKPHRKDDPESRLGIVFDKVLLRHRAEVDFRGVVHALSAPAITRSRVDEPDEMMAPGMMGMRQSQGPMPVGGNTAMGRSPPGSAGGGSGTALNPAGSPPSLSNGPPMSPVPTTSAGNSAGGIPNQTVPPPISSEGQPPMSVGMPLGVFGLKGLSLTPGASASTPGPVILSRLSDVKLESGTQVLLKITDPTLHKP